MCTRTCAGVCVCAGESQCECTCVCISMSVRCEEEQVCVCVCAQACVKAGPDGISRRPKEGTSQPPAAPTALRCELQEKLVFP